MFCKPSFSILDTHSLIGNLPWIVHVFRYMARGTKRKKAFDVLEDTAIRLVQQRRKDNNPTKVSYSIQTVSVADSGGFVQVRTNPPFFPLSLTVYSCSSSVNM